ncbi:hypothetical protein XH90_03465 [Bradyrhizobium sp. CCBAU 53338]|nr:hypothetical protein XH90_03465 [Bradyrhizobium sp. CCBAU 53338]
MERPDADTDLSVIAGVTLEAFSKAWGGEDTTGKPTIERVLSVTFTVLAELGLTLAEAPLLFDRDDRYGFRAWAAKTVCDRYARDELLRLHELSLDRKRARDFDVEVIGPINRIARFLRPHAVSAMVGQSERTIDFRAAMDEGHVILCNLSGGSRVYEHDADLLGRLLTRAIFFHARRRKSPERPFIFYIDECHRFLSGDLENILAEVRKYGIGVVLSHQWLEQLKVQSDNMLAAVRNATNLKIVFRVKDPREAEDLAEMVMPLDLEVPIRGLIKPVLVGHELVHLKGQSTTDQESISETCSWSTGITIGESHSYSEGHSDGFSEGTSSGESFGTTTSSSFAASETAGIAVNKSQSRDRVPDGRLFPIITEVHDTDGVAQSDAQSLTQSSSEGMSRVSTQGHSSTRSTSTNSSETHATSIARQYSRSVGIGNSRGRSYAQGQQEAFKPILRDLPSAMHSKENVLYMAATALRGLTTGRAFVSFVGSDGMRTALLTVPHVHSCALSNEEFERLRGEMLDASPSALPAEEAQASVEARERSLIERIELERIAEEPTTFRVKKERSPKS